MKTERKTLPLRFRILEYASHRSAFTISDLLHDLKDEYGGEGQFTFRMLSQHCDSLRASGMIEDIRTDVGENETLLFTYRLTDYGRGRLGYLPQIWKGADA